MVTTSPTTNPTNTWAMPPKIESGATHKIQFQIQNHPSGTRTTAIKSIYICSLEVARFLIRQKLEILKTSPQN